MSTPKKQEFETVKKRKGSKRSRTGQRPTLTIRDGKNKNINGRKRWLQKIATEKEKKNSMGKLLQIELKTFDGNVLKWTEF